MTKISLKKFNSKFKLKHQCCNIQCIKNKKNTNKNKRQTNKDLDNIHVKISQSTFEQFNKLLKKTTNDYIESY